MAEVIHCQAQNQFTELVYQLYLFVTKVLK
jgi:hypothetical protein